MTGIIRISRVPAGTWLIQLILTGILLTGCSQEQTHYMQTEESITASETTGGYDQSLTRYQASFLGVFDTVTTMVGYSLDKDTFTAYAQELKTELEEYHQLYDIYNDYPGINNIKTINDNAGIRPVEVDVRIIDLLEEAVEMYQETGGRVNAAMGSVLSLWHHYRMEGIDDPEHAALPPMAELERLAEHTDITKLKIDRKASTVYLEDPEMSLDVGAVAKGYATEMVCRKLEEDGLLHALVSVGGNTRAIGSKPDGSLWQVGIQNPDLDSEEKNLHIMELQDLSLVQSGTYQRYYTVDGVQYHHIIHPELLMPWKEYVSVVILCPDSGLADALSTAVFNMEQEEGLEFIEDLDGVEAMWILPDGTERYSSGFLDHMEE
ncbi:MAG: FAD:protein FMN transferase [Lachnospiraceae bacterium]|nr:FAD:protein FMN transferase [Lachnospiraceae bacterium]